MSSSGHSKIPEESTKGNDVKIIASTETQKPKDEIRNDRMVVLGGDKGKSLPSGGAPGCSN